ncbi:MAG: ribbon-helix-helix domain-containing protein [Candidatus Ranarchaeia archaeon]
MKLTTFKLPTRYLAALDELVHCGRYANRSEAIRSAIRDLLTSELPEFTDYKHLLNS